MTESQAQALPPKTSSDLAIIINQEYKPVPFDILPCYDDLRKRDLYNKQIAQDTTPHIAVKNRCNREEGSVLIDSYLNQHADLCLCNFPKHLLNMHSKSNNI